MDEFTEYLQKKLREQNNTLDLEAARTIERMAAKCDELEKNCEQLKKLNKEMLPYLQHTCQTCAWLTPAPSCKAPGGTSECIRLDSWKWKGEKDLCITEQCAKGVCTDPIEEYGL